MPRDYKEEYRRRIAIGAARGLSRSASRGHPRAEDLGPLPPRHPNRHSEFEIALKLVKRGSSLRSAARKHGLSEERLRHFVKRSTTAKYENGHWLIFDLRPQFISMISGGKVITVEVAIDDASEVARHINAVGRFLDTNDIDYLVPFFGQGVRDLKGKFHPFEVRPNTLRKIDTLGELEYLEIYANVAPVSGGGRG